MSVNFKNSFQFLINELGILIVLTSWLSGRLYWMIKVAFGTITCQIVSAHYLLAASSILMSRSFKGNPLIFKFMQKNNIFR